MLAQNLTSENSNSSSSKYCEKLSDSDFILTKTQSISLPDIITHSFKSSSSKNRWLDDRQVIKKLDFNTDSYDNDEHGSQFSLSDL